MRRLLMVAYHFPPLAGSSGIQRTLRLVQQLPRLGWQPLVLSADPLAYERTSEDLLADIPPGTVVQRAFALDAARHLSLGGRYLGATARPDRWASWRFDAVRQGLRLIERHGADLLWTTYPIATAHVIGAELHRRTGLPWIADFRDPMAQEGYPSDPATWKRYLGIEAGAMEHAALNLFTTPGAARLYRARYPQAAHRIAVLENGYDEESFAAAENAPGLEQPLNPGCLTLLHSGIVYPSERDPAPLFAALARLQAGGAVTPGQLRLRFRSPVHEDLLRGLAARHGVQGFVEIVPPLPYREALAEMLRADGLLVLQAANCNEQVPAKIYEYLRAGRPILCLSDPAGDTEGVLRAAGVRDFARLDSADEIAERLPAFLAAVRERRAVLPSAAAVRGASRRARAEALARHLDAIAARRAVPC